jgi:hypothetical protein
MNRCLAFHENRRSIRTASVTQVRKPIYASSVGRWRHYEKHLAPLMAGLSRIRAGQGLKDENRCRILIAKLSGQAYR